MKKSVLTNYPVLMITAFMLFMTAGLGYAATYYVWRDNPSPAAPFDTWAKAADNIQAAVDVSASGDTVLVTNGVYDTGGAKMSLAGFQLTNRVYIAKAITVRSMNGPGLTTIKGAEAPGGGVGTGAIRCAAIDNVAGALIGFTLTGGYTMNSNDTGGGAWWWTYMDQCGGGLIFNIFPTAGMVVSNCVISGNTANSVGGGAILLGGGTLNNCALVSNKANIAQGGGAYIGTAGMMNNCTVVGNKSLSSSGGGVYLDHYPGGTLNNCLVASNTAGAFGGGAYFAGGGTLNNCTVINNNAGSQGGGLRVTSDATGTGTVNNCIVWLNTETTDDSYSNILISGTAFINYTCSGPTPAIIAGNLGSGNIGSDPMLTDIAAGNYRLTKGSPCINTGTNFSWMTDSTDVRSKDLDGHSRIDRFSGIVDMGAYEQLYKGAIFGGY